MRIFDDSFSIELNHPLDKEAWKVLEDAELDNTEHIYFTTPSGKRVDFIKADVIDKIRAEIETLYDSIDTVSHNEYDNAYEQGREVAFECAMEIIDKYKAESEKEE